MFPCDRGTQRCLNTSVLCNEHNECADLSDEKQEVCDYCKYHSDLTDSSSPSSCCTTCCMPGAI